MILYYLASVFYVLVCVLLLMVILLQQGKGDMAAAFGGGSSQSAFGARAGATVLSKATAVLAVLFMLGPLAHSRGPLPSPLRSRGSLAAARSPLHEASRPSHTPPHAHSRSPARSLAAAPSRSLRTTSS